MRLYRFLAVPITALALVSACDSADDGANADGTWVGTITSEGKVTTVVNESGSVWGGAATLVEEASIGVDVGADEYMLGRVEAIAVRDDRIYVLDRQAPALRVYDFAGRHVANIGRQGAGPGEFNVPWGLAVAPDGRVFVRDTTQGRINVYDATGRSVATWPMVSTFFTARPLVATVDGKLYTEVVVSGDPASPERRRGLQGYRPDGSLEEVIPEPGFGFEPQRVIVRRSSGGSSTIPVPFAPSPVWTLAPSGAFVSGTGDEYQYEVRYREEGTLLVRREIPRVPVAPAEAAYYRRRLRESVARSGGVNASVDGDLGSIPGHKPAFERLIAGHEGSVWVVREGTGVYFPNCGGDAETDPCWRSARIVDAFGSDGRYLGEVDVPEGLRVSLGSYISGDVVVASFQDDAGTIMVKRYRLVRPGEEAS